MLLRCIYEYVAGNCKTYLGCHVNCPIFCLISTKFGFSRQISIEAPRINFLENPSNGSRADTCRDRQTYRQTYRQTNGQMDGRTEGNYKATTLFSQIMRASVKKSHGWRV
jgi:hypothetical protein